MAATQRRKLKASSMTIKTFYFAAAAVLLGVLLGGCSVDQVTAPPPPNPNQNNPGPSQTITNIQVRNKPEEIPADGQSQMLITATVATDNGLPAIGSFPITFQTTNAETTLLDPVSGVTSNTTLTVLLSNGSFQAIVFLVAPPREGHTRINAWLGSLPGGLTDSINIRFPRPLDEIRITITAVAMPDPTIPPVGARFHVEALVTNLNGDPLIGVPVLFSIEEGMGFFELARRDFTEADGIAKTEVKITSLIALLRAEYGNAVATVVVQVGGDQDQFPTACFTFSPSSPVEDEPVTFDAQCSSDADGTLVSFTWNFGDGTPVVTTGSPTITHTFTEIGSYTVRLLVTDDDGLVSAPFEDTVSVTNNQSPTCSFTVSPTNPTLEDTVFFDASATSDPDGTIVRYEWNFGDGNTAVTVTPTVSHVYTRKGTYTVTLRAFDNDGAFCSTTRTVTFANTAPTACLVLMPDAINVSNGFPQVVTLDAACSTDPDGDELRYCPSVASIFDPDGTATTTTIQVDFIGGSSEPVQQARIFDSGNNFDGDETITFRMTVTDQTNITSCDAAALNAIQSKDSDDAVLEVNP